ncbi:hypothetical protein ACOME3_006936 [Neoechinorhynchus agilis]
MLPNALLSRLFVATNDCLLAIAILDKDGIPIVRYPPSKRQEPYMISHFLISCFASSERFSRLEMGQVNYCVQMFSEVQVIMIRIDAPDSNTSVFNHVVVLLIAKHTANTGFLISNFVQKSYLRDVLEALNVTLAPAKDKIAFID